MSRKPLCKTCVSYQPQKDGSVVCDFSGATIEKNSQPLYENGTCYERKQKKKLTPQELSLIRSTAGRKGGRTAGYGKGRAPTKQMSVRLHDHKVFTEYSRKKGHAVAEQFHIIASEIVKKYPELKPPEWID